MSLSSSKIVKNNNCSYHPLKIGVVGDFQIGKSTMLNCILGGVYASTGCGLSTTSRSTEYCWGKVSRILRKSTHQLVSPKRFFSDTISKSDNDDYIYEVNNSVLEYVSLIDTPGINANQEDTSTAYAAFSLLDAAIVVIQNKGLNTEVKSILTYFESIGLPYIIIMNCTIQQSVASWYPDSSFNTTILDNLTAQLKGDGFKPYSLYGNTITPVNLFWYWYSIGEVTPEDEDIYDKQLAYIDRILSKDKDFDFKAMSNLLLLLDFLHNRVMLSSLFVYTNLLKTTKNLPTIAVASLDNYYAAFESTISDGIKRCEQEQIKLRQSIPEYESELEELRTIEPRLRDFSMLGIAVYLKERASQFMEEGKRTYYRGLISNTLDEIESSKRYSSYLQSLLTKLKQ